MEQQRQNASLKPHQKALILATILAVLAWTVPVLSWVMLPLQYLNAHLHEMSHAIMTILTGGSVAQITVHSDGSGETPVAGGGIFLIGSAGYMGAALIGALMVYFGRTERGARMVLRTVGAALAVSMIIWVRGDVVGVVSGIAWIAVLFACSSLLRGLPLLFGVQFFGLQQCFTSMQAVYTVLQISTIGERHSDAQILASVTGVPALIWAFAWCALSAILMFVTVRAAWSHGTEPYGSRSPSA